MASSSSSSSPRTWRYNVFTSFHGPDTRIKFLSHLRQQFNYNGITMFDDNGIERSQIIAPALTKAIKESRIAIVLLSKNYASSSWCLDELLEILKCKEEIGQTVMTVFYEVDPSHVRKQTGDFGKAFNKTCDGKTEEKKKKWSQALFYVGNIAGEHFQNWDNEAKMIEKISSDISHKLNDTPSRDFDGMVGLEGHLRKMESLLDLAYDGAKIVGISGPAGIGKSTIARALHSRFSNRFQHTCFMDNLRENYKSGLAEYGLKVRLHEQFLSNILNLNGIRISHLGVIKDRLQDKKVLIILDDVEHLDQLETLANIEWFGPGSRVIVTTENNEILQQHGIIDVYPVGFPSGREALMIFCLSAFRQTYPPVEFMNLAYEVVKICGNLPLSLCVLGSSLRGKSQADWIDELPRLKNCLDGRIESVLKVGYESLHESDQTLFLLIAIFFNHAHVDHVTSMLTKNNLVFSPGRLKTLVNRYLVHHENSKVVMHHLLQVMARQIISKQEPWKRQILIDVQEIFYLLENAEGNRSTVGISFDVAEIDELILSARAFERMRNLLFLKVYDWWHNGKSKLHIPEEMEFLPCLRLLSWDAYPRKSLPRKFCPKNLVELRMPDSQLEKLWEGPQLLANLKTMNLSRSSRLKELPDLSNATNLESLDLFECVSLVELPSSISSLHKLHFLETNCCRSLEVIPTLTNLGSLEEIHMIGCLRLSSFPDIPTSIVRLSVMDTTLEECPASLRHLSFLKSFDTSGSVNLKTFQTYLPTSVTEIHLDNCGIERITDCIGLHNLRVLVLSNCTKLTSLPELPGSLKFLRANNCESLERVSVPLNTPNARLDFSNCFKLGRQARRAIIQQLFVGGWAVLPGSKVPIEFDHRARGNLLTIPHSVFYRYKVGVVISTEYDHQARESTISRLWCRCIVMESSTDMKFVLSDVSKNRAGHLLIFHATLPFIEPSEVNTKIVFEFKSLHKHFNIIECGVQILTDETDGNNNGGFGDGNDLWDTQESSDIVVQSESGEGFDKEDDEEGYKSESGEASKDKDEDMANDGNYESVSRKRPRNTMMITSATTTMKSFIQRRRLKRKMNHKSSLYSRSFRIALLELRSRRKPTPSKHL